MALYWSDAELHAIVTPKHPTRWISSVFRRPHQPLPVRSAFERDKTNVRSLELNEITLSDTWQDAVSCKIRHRPGKNVPASGKKGALENKLFS